MAHLAPDPGQTPPPASHHLPGLEICENYFHGHEQTKLNEARTSDVNQVVLGTA
jgi:hypothetical protein